LWPYWIHERIIDNVSNETAFMGLLTSAERQMLREISSDQDDPFQGGWHMARAHEHGLDGVGDRQLARALHNEFVTNSWNDVRMHLRRGDRHRALESFGRILHAVTDVDTPGHGFQSNPSGFMASARHLYLEMYFDEEQPQAFIQRYQTSASAARQAFALLDLLLRGGGGVPVVISEYKIVGIKK